MCQQWLEVDPALVDKVDGHSITPWAILLSRLLVFHRVLNSHSGLASILTLKLPIILTSLFTKIDIGIKLFAGPAPT